MKNPKEFEQSVRENVLAMEIIHDLQRTAKIRAEVAGKILDPEVLSEDDLNKVMGYILELSKESEDE